MTGEGWIGRLREVLARRAPRVLEREARAAVLVPIVDDGGPLRLILTRRTRHLPTHQGHVAFPGGHVQAKDRDVVATALREADEEIGLAPDRVEVLGPLDDLLTHDGRVAVTPIVGRVAVLPVLRPRPEEVDRVFSIPVAELADPGRWVDDAFHHDGEILWGLSARIVASLFREGR